MRKSKFTPSFFSPFSRHLDLRKRRRSQYENISSFLPKKFGFFTTGKVFSNAATERLELFNNCKIYSYGQGFLGSLGHGNFEDQSHPKLIQSLKSYNVRDLSAGLSHSGIITTCGRCFYFGRSHDIGKIMHENRLWKSLPFFVSLHQYLKKWTDKPLDTSMIKQSEETLLMTKEKKNTASIDLIKQNYAKWNSKIYQQINIEGYMGEECVLSPKEIFFPEPIIPASISCSAAFTCILDEDGNVWTFGDNGAGQCGMGDTGNKVPIVYVPYKIQSLAKEKIKITQIATGFQHVIALTSTGKVLSWGKGTRGQLGLSDYEHRNYPDVVHLHNPITGIDENVVIKIDAGFGHGAALTSNGNVYIWGKMMGTTVKGQEKNSDFNSNDNTTRRAEQMKDNKNKNNGRAFDEEMESAEKISLKIPIFEDQPTPRLLDIDTTTWKVIDISCAAFHTAILVQNKLNPQYFGLFIQGRQSTSKEMCPFPFQIAIPSTSLSGEGDSLARSVDFTNSSDSLDDSPPNSQRKMRIGKMGNYTILELTDGSIFKVDFDGVGSTFESLIPEELSIQEDPVIWASQGLHHTLVVTGLRNELDK